LPLYISEAAIREYFCHEVAEALCIIKSNVEKKAVTPTIALGLIKQHLQPLIPTEHHDVIAKIRMPSWQDIHYPYMVFTSRSAESDGPLDQIAMAFKTIWMHTKSPPRDFPDFDVIEVTYFFLMYDYIDRPVRINRHPGNNKKIDPFLFCKYCWRQPVPKRALCPHHAAGGDEFLAGVRESKTHAMTLASRRREGMRQKEIFDKTVNRLLTYEVTRFHKSLFTAKILLPETSIMRWLKRRRPTIAKLLPGGKNKITDENVVNQLLEILHGTESLHGSTLQRYIEINDHIRAYPFLIWPMLIRAEAWFLARNELQSGWGGRRAGAGRKALSKSD
jgi:hypothetical protein